MMYQSLNALCRQAGGSAENVDYETESGQNERSLLLNDGWRLQCLQTCVKFFVVFCHHLASALKDNKIIV